VQQVKASISNGAFVVFNAKAQQAIPIADPPVVRAIWPRNGIKLGANEPAPAQQWFLEWQRGPRIQLTFDRKMNAVQLNAPDPWLRVYAFIQQSSNLAVSQPPLVRRILLSHIGPTGSPLIGISGVTEEYALEIPTALRRTDTRYLVQINAQSGNIVEAGPPGLLLDAEFDGTKLKLTQLDKIWPVDDATATDMNTFSALASGSQTLPQSGNGIPGGRFHSWFEVLP
jgi:hypothetical protein